MIRYNSNIAVPVFFLLLFSTAAFSADGPSSWACRETNSYGLKWEIRRWAPAEFSRSNFILNLNGARSSISTNGDSSVLECTASIFSEIVTCSSIFGNHLMFNTVTHVGTASSIFGGVIGPGDDSFRDNLQIKTFQCTGL